ncbi:MAG: glycosyltransferase family 2 protein [Rickettsiales bacterium]|jgi:glycosyltransferase involved in cell wall biosynthesis|nr:glycosyltransferase family 2 protein [Rickettsiales bacterium]
MVAKPDISIVVPMHNESDVIGIFFEEVRRVLDSLVGLSYEFLCVDDGSRDDTLQILRNYAREDSRVKIVSFSRNFRKEAAMMAGLEHCSGRCAVVIDADLQDPPELIFNFVEKWREGYEIVYGIRNDRTSESFLKRTTSGIFYRTYNIIAEPRMPENAGDYRLLDRKVIDAIVKSIGEKNLFMKGIFNWIGFKSYGVNYTVQKRKAGLTKWNYWKLWNFAIDGIASFSTLPLRIWTYLGCLLLIGSVLYLVASLAYLRISMILFLFLLISGLQFISMGILGEYVGRILIEVKNRPLYIVKEKINFYD